MHCQIGSFYIQNHLQDFVDVFGAALVHRQKVSQRPPKTQPCRFLSKSHSAYPPLSDFIHHLEAPTPDFSSKPMLRGLINHKPAVILLDTGAEINIMSYATTSSFGLIPKMIHDGSRNVLLANGLGERSLGYVMAPFQMEYYQTPTPVQIWVVTNKVVADLKILFGQPFINQTDSLSVKPPILTWLEQPYSYGYYPQSSPDGAPKVPTSIQSVVLDTEFMDADEIEKYFVPYLPETFDAAKDADINPDLPLHQRQHVIALLNTFQDVFTGNFDAVDVGMELEIPLKNPKTVVCCPHRPLSHADNETQLREVKEMLRMGVIRPSRSHFNCPTVLVDKPDGTKRHCNDFSPLNKHIEDYNYILPRVTDNLSRFFGFDLFSVLDLRHGFWQLSLAEKDRFKTAFSTSIGKFEYVKVPMGLKTSPRYFQQVMHKIFHSLLNKHLESYQDDILLKGKGFEQSLFILRQSLEIIRKHKLKLRIEKCKFLYSKVKYLGFVVNPQSMSPPTDKLKAIQSFLPPESLKELQCFLGLANQYRHFIND
eukprot:NODE_1157_length_1981_cov_0.648778.p1 type:complete len:537 gc:universal NODE_1157_length_1981_cov_0.648778:1732-122(-)